MKTPSHKLKAIKDAGEAIIYRIVQFYSQINENVNIDNINENILSLIFLFCIIKAKIYEILIHLNFINNLIKINLTDELSSLYFNSLKLSVAYLTEESFKMPKRFFD